VDANNRRVRAPAPARSEKEILRFMGSIQPCRACGHEGLIVVRYSRSIVRGEAAIVDANCALCSELAQVAFDAGPSWENQPLEADLRMATGDAPSELIPESVFRTDLEWAWRQIEMNDELDEWSRRSEAASVVTGLLEIRKLKVATGGDLSPDDQQLLRRCCALVVENGGSLPAEVAALVGVDGGPPIAQPDVIDVGEVASRKEAYFHAVQTAWTGCPRCSAKFPKLTTPLPHQLHYLGYEAKLSCNECGTNLVQRYRPGNGWDQQPDANDRRITSVKTPSPLLKASFLLAFAEQQAENVRGGGGAQSAGLALEALDELEKFSDFVIPNRAAYAKLKKFFRDAIG
jgi:hypothetical protein